MTHAGYGVFGLGFLGSSRISIYMAGACFGLRVGSALKHWIATYSVGTVGLEQLFAVQGMWRGIICSGFRDQD